MRPYTDAGTGSFLETADAIGERLSREAVWYQARCNWVGAEPVEPGRSTSMTYKALGPELYSGTSGVALFLAELHAVTGDVSARQTALGAIRQALKHADAVASRIRLGLYTGWPGIAFAAARVGTLLGEEELLEHASQLLQHCVVERQGEHDFDLLSGYAGAIAALVVLRNILDDASSLDFATQLGEELLRSADETEAGYSWRSVAYPKQRNLTGFSLGTAGVGYALLELSRATDDSRYLEAAEHAFRYERYWFDAAAGNWPDFREEPARGKRGKHPLSFTIFWCHGAPGIALSRLRACEVLHDETCKAEAITALRTTRGMTEAALRSGLGNFSLCHGLTGNAEVLLYGRQVLGKGLANESALAFDIAKAGVEIAAKRRLPWPCGTGFGETQSLMLGLAGIGHFFLRLRDPTIPSVLLLRREDFSSYQSNEVMKWEGVDRG